MSFPESHLLRNVIVGFMLLSGSVFAQNETAVVDDEPTVQTETAVTENESVPELQANPDPETPTAVRRANPTSSRGGVVSLQTTVTGNQEQPRVLYILPWQSPAASDVDFELLDSQQTSVFGHIERNELRRELEAAGEFD